MPKYTVTFRKGISSDKTFDSDFQAINETHRPTAPQTGIVQIHRYEDGVACQGDGTTSLPRAWDHPKVSSSIDLAF